MTSPEKTETIFTLRRRAQPCPGDFYRRRREPLELAAAGDGGAYYLAPRTLHETTELV